MASITIVTDTSSDLLPDQAREAGIRLVPLTVSFGDESFEAVTELSNEEFYERLTAPGAPFPRTAAPNPAAFEAAYRTALDAGADGVFCVTISDRLSATYSAAVKGAEAFSSDHVVVLDSRTTTHSLGLIARAAAEIAASGADLKAVVARAEDVRRRSGIYFTVDTLEYLQKGGRIGRASALLGTALAIKPILFVEDGMVATADKRRTVSKARARLLELATARPLERAVVLHTMTPDIEAFRDQLASASGLGSEAIELGLTGPVAGAHVGPGMVGVSLLTTA
jgi:DegV family protein with EDD domain